MAIEFTDVTVGSKTKKGVVVSTEGDVDQVILKDALAPIDIKFLDIVSEADGDTFGEKLEATTLPNGLNAAVFFANRVVGVDVLVARQKRQEVQRDVVGAVVALQDAAVQGDGGEGGVEGG